MKQLKYYLIIVFSIIVFHMNANVSLPSFFGSHMVLQQNSEIKIWGWGKPLEEIKIQASWDNQLHKTITNNQANWEITIPTPKAGGPYSITIEGYNKTILEDILIGEVWLCSGQSNMEWTPRMGINNAQQEIASANHPSIRLFSVTHRTAAEPNYDVNGHWNVCTPETMIDFSATAYFFARELQKQLGVPVGLINASWGGTPAEVWTPKHIIENNPLLLESSKKIQPMEWGPHQPGRAYNAMIAPLSQFKIAGCIWYQGETNTANPETYSELMQGLITSWRSQWGYEFPFYLAQIAPYMYDGESGVLLQNAQRKATTLANTGMIVTNDIAPDTTNIHPTNKQDVGVRFAKLALHNTYQKTNICPSGPIIKKATLKGNKVILEFDYAQGLTTKGNPIEDFEICDSSNKFEKAQASIKNNTIIVFSKNIKNPTLVRFAWKNTAQPKIWNAEGLPISCFYISTE